MKTVKELLKRLEIAETASDKAEKAYAEDYMNEEKEHAFDEAYKIQFDLYVETAKELTRVTYNNIDFVEAKKLIMTKRENLKALLANN